MDMRLALRSVPSARRNNNSDKNADEPLKYEKTDEKTIRAPGDCKLEGVVKIL
jgi:hypothetical protein